MQVIMKKIKEITPYENNPRNNKKAVEFVMNSIKEFGFKQPIVIDGEGVIVCGHTRYQASRKLKLKEVPCILADDLTEEQINAYRLADNKTAEMSEWDLGKLEIEMENIEIDMSQFGFVEITEEPEAEEDDFDEEELGDFEVKTIIGDIYKLGEHRLMCGDSTKLGDVKKLMDGQNADLLVTDPPYNVSYEGKTKDKLKIENDEMNDTSFREFLKNAFFSACTVMKPGAVFYIWHADSEGYNFRGACFDVGLKVRQCLIWNKNSMVMGRQDYHWKHEPCLYGWKDGAGHLWASDRKQTTILNFDRPQRNGEHPTMKPVGLFAYQISNNTKGQDIVLDLFGGVGYCVNCK